MRSAGAPSGAASLPIAASYLGSGYNLTLFGDQPIHLPAALGLAQFLRQPR